MTNKSNLKRITNLYNNIISTENLYIANKRAILGKRKRKDIIKYQSNLEQNITQLHNELLNKTYSTSNYSNFTIYEPKERFISKLPYRDRIIHHAILNHLEPILTKCFTTNTYSCIKYRGIHKCLRDLNNALRNNDTEYCLKLDIKKFYPSVNNNLLKQLLRRKFKDKDLLYLLDNIIDSFKGLPLGNYTSQWFGNFYLNQFDHWLKQTKKVKYYFRYCDDLVILSNNKEELHQLRKDIQEYLLSNLHLQLSNYQVFPVKSRGIDFLGYKSYHSHIRLRKSIKNRFRRMLEINYNQKSIASYHGWLVHSNSINLENKLLTINKPSHDNN